MKNTRYRCYHECRESSSHSRPLFFLFSFHLVFPSWVIYSKSHVESGMVGSVWGEAKEGGGRSGPAPSEPECSEKGVPVGLAQRKVSEPSRVSKTSQWRVAWVSDPRVRVASIWPGSRDESQVSRCQRRRFQIWEERKWERTRWCQLELEMLDIFPVFCSCK